MTSFMVPAAGATAAVVAGSGSGLTSDLALTIVAYVGNILVCFLIVAPLRSFVTPILRQNTVGQRTVYGHVLMMASGAAWGLYGIPAWPKTRVSVYINAACFAFQLVYVLVFIWYAEGQTRWTAVGLLLAALVVSGALAYMVLVKVMAWGESVISRVATVASVVSCLSYMAVGVDIQAVANSQDVSNMDPLLEVLLNMLNAATWVYYAYLSDPVDIYIGVPNAVGVVFLAVQLGVYFRHCRAEPEPAPEPQPPVQAEDDFGPDLVLLFATPAPSPRADHVPDPEIEVVIAEDDVPDPEIEVVIA